MMLLIALALLSEQDFTSYKKAVIIVAIMALLGACSTIYQQNNTTATVAKGIVDASALPMANVCSSFVRSYILVTILTVKGASLFQQLRLLLAGLQALELCLALL